MRFYTAFLIIFFLYLAASIFIGFFAHISINNWTLIAAFASYCIAAMGYMFYRRLGRRGFILLLAAVVLTPLLYWTTTYMFGQTYDLSYDGQDYQQSAIIALADNWNPIYQKAMPIHINNPVDEPAEINDSGRLIH
jgi:amino acid transporter